MGRTKREEDPRPRPRLPARWVPGRCPCRGCARCQPAQLPPHLGRLRARPRRAGGGGGAAVSGSRRSCPHRHAGRAPAPPGAPASGDTAARTALPSSAHPVPPLSLLCPFCPSSVPPLSPAGWQRGQRKQEAAIKSCGKTFPLFGCFGFFLSGWLARLFSLLILAFARARVASFLCKSLPPAPAGLKSCWFGFSPPPVLNQRVRYVITASIAFKHINLIKHWSNHTHASLLNHAAQISTTIEDIKSYLSYQSKLISC